MNARYGALYERITRWNEIRVDKPGMNIRSTISDQYFHKEIFVVEKTKLLSDKSKKKLSNILDFAKFQDPLIFPNSHIPWIKN